MEISVDRSARSPDKSRPLSVVINHIKVHKCAVWSLQAAFGHVHTTLDTLTRHENHIPDGASVHIQKLCFWHEFCNGVKLCRADLESVASHISLRTANVSPRSSPLRDVSREGTSATQRQKFAKRPSAAMSEEKRLLFAGQSHIRQVLFHTLPKLCSVSVNRYSNRSGSARINRRRK